MPSRRHSSAIFSSPRSPSKTIRTFSSAEYFLRVLRWISCTVASTAALVSSLMVYSLARLILTRKSHLSFSPYFVSQVLKRNSYPPETRLVAICMYVEGNSYNAIGRILKVNPQSVVNWVKTYTANLPAAPVPEKPRTAELDELYT